MNTQSPHHHHNKFHYDRDSRIVLGYYDDEVDPDALANLVADILYEENASTTTSAIGVFAHAIGDVLAGDCDKLDYFSSLISKIDEIVETPKASLFEQESAPWLDEIAKEQDAVVRRDLIANYIAVVSKYVAVNIQYDQTDSINNALCQVCGALLERTASDTYNECGECGTLLPQYVNASKYVEIEELAETPIKAGARDPYLKFQRQYLRYQGRASIVIPNEDIATIKRHIATYYANLRGDLSRRSENLEVLRKCLKATKLTRHRQDINVVANVIWGWPLPDTRHLDTTIERNWRIGQRGIDRLKLDSDPETINFNDWRLYKEYAYAGYDCDIDDFAIPTNKKTLLRYDELWAARIAALEASSE